jgi:DNA-binding transcriptional regulator YiaG
VQAAFADMFGVSRILVQGWERGVREPSTLARRLLNTFAVDPPRWIATLGETRSGKLTVRSK